MTKKWKGALVAGLLATVATTAFAAGLYTNGLPTVGAAMVNAVAAVAPNGVWTQVEANGSTGAVAAPLVPVDTGLPRGAAPQTVAVSPFQLGAGALGDCLINPGTSTTHAVTLNTVGGLITTEALSTAAGSTYTFTLTNSLITTSTAAPQVAMYSGTNTGGHVKVTSVTNAAGSAVIVFTNDGSTAFNGTMAILFHI